MKTMSRTLVFAVVPQMVSCLQESDAQCAPQPTSSELGSCWVVQTDVEFVILMLLACCKLSVLGYLTRVILVLVKKSLQTGSHSLVYSGS